MSDFRFYIPIQVRYGDLDAQGHVNNSRFLTYLEQARFQYLLDLGLWDGEDFNELGLIVADVHLAFVAPIELRDKIRAGLRVAHIGNKSMRFEHVLEDVETGKVLATSEIVMVAYDYHTKTSRPVPADWRAKIAEYEGISEQ